MTWPGGSPPAPSTPLQTSAAPVWIRALAAPALAAPALGLACLCVDQVRVVEPLCPVVSTEQKEPVLGHLGQGGKVAGAGGRGSKGRHQDPLPVVRVEAPEVGARLRRLAATSKYVHAATVSRGAVEGPGARSASSL